MDGGEIVEEKPGTLQKCRQRSVMIGRHWVKAGLNIGEVLLEKDGHICVKTFAVGNLQFGMGTRSRFIVISSRRRLG
jgi:hypothetical protein